MQPRDYHRNMQQVMNAANRDPEANIKRHLANLSEGILEEKSDKIEVKFGERIPADDEHKED